MAEDKVNSPDYEHPQYGEMAPLWQITRDLCAGTPVVRGAGKEYLIPNMAEDDIAYNHRLQKAVLFNAFDRTLNSLVGLVFKEDVSLADDNPAPIVEHWENIDNAGTHGAVFAKQFFTHMLRDGHAASLVDMPPAVSEGATLADERATNRRPYWVGYQAHQIKNWRTTAINGQTTLELIVFEEVTLEPVGAFGLESVTRYRVLRLVEGVAVWELYRRVEQKNGEDEIILEASGTTSLNRIPVAIGYSRYEGVLQSRPPLIDLALLNLAHYNKYSDFSTLLHLTLPILCAKLRDRNNDSQVIGPYALVDVAENGDVWYAEPTGAGLKPQAEDLAAIEERMAKLGLAMLSAKAPQKAQTATETILDNLQEQSDLATSARSCQDALELALGFHAAYLGLEGGSVEMGSSGADLVITPEKMKVLIEAVGANVLSVETVQEILVRAGELPEDFDTQQEVARIEARQASIGEQALRLFDRGEAPIQ